jgi:hypothetical protein
MDYNNTCLKSSFDIKMRQLNSDPQLNPLHTVKVTSQILLK